MKFGLFRGKGKKNVEMQYRTFQGISPERISEMEHQLQVELPGDYKNFLQKWGGCIAEVDLARDYEKIIRQERGVLDTQNGTGSIFVKDLEGTVWLDVLFGDIPDMDSLNITTWTEEFEYELPEDCIIIGTTLCHCYFGLICKGEDQGVYLWDCSHYYESSNEVDGNAYWIADTFSEFLLNVLDKPEQHLQNNANQYYIPPKEDENTWYHAEESNKMQEIPRLALAQFLDCEDWITRE